jgi:hypothetical protein
LDTELPIVPFGDRIGYFAACAQISYSVRLRRTGPEESFEYRRAVRARFIPTHLRSWPLGRPWFIAQHEQADRIFMHQRPRGERPDLPPTGSSAAGTAGPWPCHMVGPQPRTPPVEVGASGKAVTESNLSLRAPAQRADLRGRYRFGPHRLRARISGSSGVPEGWRSLNESPPQAGSPAHLS